jgi:hypothetical protein
VQTCATDLFAAPLHIPQTATDGPPADDTAGAMRMDTPCEEGSTAEEEPFECAPTAKAEAESYHELAAEPTMPAPSGAAAADRPSGAARSVLTYGGELLAFVPSEAEVSHGRSVERMRAECEPVRTRPTAAAATPPPPSPPFLHPLLLPLPHTPVRTRTPASTHLRARAHNPPHEHHRSTTTRPPGAQRGRAGARAPR